MKWLTDGWIMNSGNNIDYTLLHNGLFVGTPEENVIAATSGGILPQEVVMQMYTIAMNNARPLPVVPTSKPLVAAGSVMTTLSQLADTLMVQSIMAPESSFDSVWDSGIANWLNSGAQAIIDERRANFIEP